MTAKPVTVNSKVVKRLTIGTYKRDESRAGEIGSWQNEGGGIDITKAMYHKFKQYCDEFADGKIKKYTQIDNQETW